jgi:hypothetical protein
MNRIKRGVLILLAILSAWLPGTDASAKPQTKKKAPTAAQAEPASSKPAKVVTRNGYRFELDTQGRVVRVSGDLNLENSQ